MSIAKLSQVRLFNKNTSHSNYLNNAYGRRPVSSLFRNRKLFSVETRASEPIQTENNLKDTKPVIGDDFFFGIKPHFESSFAYSFVSEPCPLEKQKEIELGSIERALLKYKKVYNDIIRLGKITALGPGQGMMLRWYTNLVEAIERLQIQLTERPMKILSNDTDYENVDLENLDIPEYSAWITKLPSSKLAIITLHSTIGQSLKTPTSTTINRIAAAIGTSIHAQFSVEQAKIEDKKIYKHLKKYYLGKKSVHIINRYTKYISRDEHVVSHATCVAAGKELLNLLLETATVRDRDEKAAFIKLPGDKSIAIEPTVVDRLIQDDNTLREFVTAIYLPMIVPPKKWKDMHQGGYIHLNSTFMRAQDFKSQYEWLMHDDNINSVNGVLDSLNVLGLTSWIVNKELLDVVVESWKSGGDIASIPSRQNIPLPEPSPDHDPRDWRRLNKKIKQHNANLHSLRCDTVLKLTVAEDFQDERMYFPHNIDFRGRCYPIPPHLNHLGPDMCRALLLFYEGKKLGKNGLYWLKIHLANVYGKDKMSFEDRIKFVESEMDNIFDSASNPLRGKRWWLSADNPWLTLAACFEMKRVMESGDPENYISHLPVHQDGTCNGLQHYAALGGDTLGAKEVNLLPGEKPGDVYAGVAKLVTKRMEEDAAQGNSLAQALLGKIDRKVVKQTVMTSVYGVTYIGAREQIANAMQDRPAMKEFCEDDAKLFMASSYITKHTFASIKEMFLGARMIMDWLGTCARAIAKSGECVKWKTPLGLAVVQPYRKESNTKHHVPTVVQTVCLEPYHVLPVNVNKQKSAFPPNYVHSLDSTHMMYTALECARQRVTYASVHDSYWTHAATVDSMNSILREQFIKLHEQPLLENLRNFLIQKSTTEDLPPVPKRGDLDLREVAKSRYFFN